MHAVEYAPPETGSAVAERPWRQRPLEAVQVVGAAIGVLSIAAGITFTTVRDPGTLEVPSLDPTPYGYTVSLSLFVLPAAALAVWFLRLRSIVCRAAPSGGRSSS